MFVNQNSLIKNVILTVALQLYVLSNIGLVDNCHIYNAKF